MDIRYAERYRPAPPRESRLKRLVARLVEPAETETGWRHLPLIRWLMVLDIAMFALVLYDAPYFHVAQVQVRGTDAVDLHRYIPVAELRGRSVLTLDADRIARAIETAPIVKRVLVERRLPDTVVIAVHERRPVAIWATGAGAYLVDDEGVVLRPATDEQLPTVYSSATAPVKLGSRVDAATVMLADRIGAEIQRSFDWQPVRYEFAAPAGLTVTTSQGWRVTFGRGDDLEYKFELLTQILQTAKARNEVVELVDLRSGLRPYYRPVRPPEALASRS